MEVKLAELFLKNGLLWALTLFLLYMVLKIEKSVQSILKELKETRENYVRKEYCVAAELEKRINEIEKSALNRIEYYRNISGWREELNEMRREMSELKNLIISLFKSLRGE